MEYAVSIDPAFQKKCPKEYLKYVGYNTQNQYTSLLFKPEVVDYISKQVTRYLAAKRVEPSGRPIIVPDTPSCHVLSSVYDAYQPNTGDIMTRYVIEPAKPDNYVKNIVDQTIEIIVSNVADNLEIDANNEKLTIWTTVLGNFNPHGLLSHSKIKVNDRHPNFGEFNMNY